MRISRTVLDQSTTPLAGAATWTSKTGRVDDYRQLRVIVSADVNGTLNVEESFDGTVWIQTSTTAITGGTPLAANIELHGYYARVKYVNGAGAQAAFNIQVYKEPIGT